MTIKQRKFELLNNNLHYYYLSLNNDLYSV